jgi:hypothetical protein
VNFAQELGRRDEEWVFVEGAPEDHHRVRPENIHRDTRPEPRAVVYADYGVFVLRQYLVEASLVLHQVGGARTIFQCPFHVSHEACERESRTLAFFEYFLDQGEHGVLIEAPAAEISVPPISDLELPAVRGRAGRNPCSLEASEVVCSCRIHDVKGALPAVLNNGKSKEYSSTRLWKNAQMYCCAPSVEPAKRIDSSRCVMGKPPAYLPIAAPTETVYHRDLAPQRDLGARLQPRTREISVPTFGTLGAQ